MAVPRNRLSNSKKNLRRSHHAKRGRQPIACPNCGAKMVPHRICQACGHYGGRQIIEVAE